MPCCRSPKPTPTATIFCSSRATRSRVSIPQALARASVRAPHRRRRRRPDPLRARLRRQRAHDALQRRRQPVRAVGQRPALSRRAGAAPAAPPAATSRRHRGDASTPTPGWKTLALVAVPATRYTFRAAMGAADQRRPRDAGGRRRIAAGDHARHGQPAVRGARGRAARRSRASSGSARRWRRTRGSPPAPTSSSPWSRRRTACAS